MTRSASSSAGFTLQANSYSNAVVPRSLKWVTTPRRARDDAEEGGHEGNPRAEKESFARYTYAKPPPTACRAHLLAVPDGVLVVLEVHTES